MKVFARFDTVRNKYHRDRYDGSEEFTTKPSEMSTDKKRLIRIGKVRTSNHKFLNSKEPKPKFVIKEFDLSI